MNQDAVVTYRTDHRFTATEVIHALADDLHRLLLHRFSHLLLAFDQTNEKRSPALNIETKREEVANQMVVANAVNKEAAKVNVVNFTIKMAYTPSKASSVNQALPTNASANAPAAPAAQVQVAKN